VSSIRGHHQCKPAEKKKKSRNLTQLVTKLLKNITPENICAGERANGRRKGTRAETMSAQKELVARPLGEKEEGRQYSSKHEELPKTTNEQIIEKSQTIGEGPKAAWGEEDLVPGTNGQRRWKGPSRTKREHILRGRPEGGGPLYKKKAVDKFYAKNVLDLKRRASPKKRPSSSEERQGEGGKCRKKRTGHQTCFLKE